MVTQQRSWARINVNLRLFERLLELTHKQRRGRLAAILDETVRAEDSWWSSLTTSRCALLRSWSRTRSRCCGPFSKSHDYPLLAGND
jgi:hypothetical protein